MTRLAPPAGPAAIRWWWRRIGQQVTRRAAPAEPAAIRCWSRRRRWRLTGGRRRPASAAIRWWSRLGGGGRLRGRRLRRSGGGHGGGEEVSSRDSVRLRGLCGPVLLHYCGDCSISEPSRLHLSLVMSYGPQLTCIGAPS